MTVCGLIFFAVNAGVLAPAESYSLRWDPKKGDASEFMFGMETPGAEPKYVVSARLRQVVDSVSGEGYRTKTTNLGTDIRMGADEMRDARKTETTVDFDARGMVKGFVGLKDTEARDAWSLGRVRSFVAPEKPVAVGGGWQVVYPERGKVPGVRLSYTLRSVTDGRATVEMVVAGNDRERPEMGRGTWIIDAKTGQWIAMDATIRGLINDGKTTAALNLRR
jgi:hypothetical protein